MNAPKKQRIAEAGNKGDNIRSDCHIMLKEIPGQGNRIVLASKVERMYGRHIHQMVTRQLEAYGIRDLQVEITDSGALDFVIMARLEAAVKQLMSTEGPSLPDMLPQNVGPTLKDRLRLSRLYLPGNSPSLMINAGIHKPHGIILDLEDSVAPSKKEEARILVRNALRAVDFYGAERMVRINPLPQGKEDLIEILPHNVHLLLIPKVEHAYQITEIEELIEQYTPDKEEVRPYIMPILESALGIEHAFEIATASERIAAMAVGLEDLTADMGVLRTKSGEETLWARQRMVNACKAAGIQPIDSVFSDVADTEGLLHNAKASRTIGFEGMGCIHPRQIRTIHEGFSPTVDEIVRAYKIKQAFDDAREKGLGVVALDNKMVDPPVVQRALKLLEMAESIGLNVNRVLTENQ